MTQTLSIGDVARRAGLSPSAVRYYDRIGLVRAHGRDAHGRRYHPQALTRLTIIKHFQHAGFSLDEIAQLLDGTEHWHALARHKRDELSERIDGLLAARRLIDEALACGCEDLEGCPAHDETGDDP